MKLQYRQPIEEIFVPIEGFENYSVSNYGWVINGTHNRDIHPRRDNGHTMVRLWRAGVQHRVHVDQLVAQAFFLDWDEFAAIVHINGDMQDNTIANLHLVNGHERVEAHWCDTHECYEKDVK
jgi:hypothetical protein